MLAVLLIGMIPSAARAATVSEFPVPTANSGPYAIAAGPDGALWFTEIQANKIGRVTTAGSFSEFAVPTATSSPRWIAAGPDGALWFTEDQGNKIGRVTTTGSFSEFAVPTANSRPAVITSGPDGALWFTELAANKIGRVTTAGAFSEFPIPAVAFPFGIVLGPDGALWFTETEANNIGRVTTSGAFSEFPVPTAGGRPNVIAPGPDGALWFTELFGNRIGRVTTAGSFSEFPVPTVNSFPWGITAGPDGALWFTEADANKIGRVTTAGSFGELTVPTDFSGPLVITSGSDGALWFTENSANKIGRVDLTAPGPPAALTLSPETAGNFVGDEHCVTATVKDAAGSSTPGIVVVFASGPTNRAQGTGTTDLGGQATFCYTGELAGTDQITAFADFDPQDGVQGPGEPAATAQKSWVPPASTPACETSNHGLITAQNGDRATFSGRAGTSAAGEASGSETYSDRGPTDRVMMRSTSIDALVCGFGDAAIFGRAKITGTEQSFRIDLHDGGSTGDSYRIRLSGGYDSGARTPSSGFVRIRF